jgi:uncharacterized integral membrane protein (TIGR00697 family)
MSNSIQQSINSQRNFKYLTFLTMLSITALLATLTVQNRLISINGINISAGMLFYPFTYIISDIIAEVYGYERAKSAIWNSIIATFIFSLAIKGTTYLPSPHFWQDYSNHFNASMGPIFRTASLGTLSILVGQFINIYILSKLKVAMRGRYFWIRSIMSSFMGDTITIIIAIFSIFINRLSPHEIMVITTYELMVMYIFAILASGPGVLIANLLKKSEGVDFFDNNTNFNPFK